MTRLTDGKRVVEITMTRWTGNGYEPDWSNDFFAVGSLPYIGDVNAYCVEHLDYCIEQALDWKNAIGDFAEDADVCSAEDIESRCVFVEKI